MRAVAERAATTTRAVYSLFGSRQGLLDELGGRCSSQLLAWLMRVPITGDPMGDRAAGD